MSAELAVRPVSDARLHATGTGYPPGPYPAYIGIDPSYSRFALVLVIEGTWGSGHQEIIETFGPERAGTGVLRLRYIHAKLSRLFTLWNSQYTVKQICYEGYSAGSKFNREAMGELGAVVQLALASAFSVTRMHSVQPTAVKKFATGSGSAAKDNMLLAVYKKWGIEFTVNDLADAYTLAMIARAIEEGAAHKYEQDVIKGVLASTKRRKGQ